MYQWKQLSPSVHHRLDLGLAFGMTDTGLVRTSNEDNFLIEPRLGLVAVADGMGGHDSGEIASADALTSIAHFIRASQDADGDPEVFHFKSSNPEINPGNLPATLDEAAAQALITLHNAVEFANQRMYQTNLSNRRGDGGGMGTTVTGIWQPLEGGPVYAFHVGDSRLYRYRDGELTQLTHDQTMYQQALDEGAVFDLPPRNLLLQALGPAFDVEPEMQMHAVVPGELLLLCSDGLYSGSSDDDIAAVLSAASAENLDTTCTRLIEMAKRDGGRDNITAVLIQCR